MRNKFTLLHNNIYIYMLLQHCVKKDAILEYRLRVFFVIFCEQYHLLQQKLGFTNLAKNALRLNVHNLSFLNEKGCHSRVMPCTTSSTIARSSLLYSVEMIYFSLFFDIIANGLRSHIISFFSSQIFLFFHFLLFKLFNLFLFSGCLKVNFLIFNFNHLKEIPTQYYMKISIRY